MPELPEVEILVRHLRPRVVGERIRDVRILRARSVWDTTPRQLAAALPGRTIRRLTRRAKYLRFDLDDRQVFLLHLGMTGRVFVTAQADAHKHDVARLQLTRADLVFHDPRQFGHLALGEDSLRGLGPEPLGRAFTANRFADALSRSRAPIKVRLLDQSLVAGIGNIYASEALWKAKLDPRMPCGRLREAEVERLRVAIVRTLRAAIRFGGGLSLDFASTNPVDGLFYHGSGSRRENPSEHFDVYDREGQPCRRCRVPIVRIGLGGRGTFFCPRCQS